VSKKKFFDKIKRLQNKYLFSKKLSNFFFPPRKKSDIYAILVPIVKSMCIFYVIILQTCLKHYKILQNKAQN
jgi:hypothetical protein